MQDLIGVRNKWKEEGEYIVRKSKELGEENMHKRAIGMGRIRTENWFYYDRTVGVNRKNMAKWSGDGRKNNGNKGVESRA